MEMLDPIHLVDDRDHELKGFWNPEKYNCNWVDYSNLAHMSEVETSLLQSSRSLLPDTAQAMKI